MKLTALTAALTIALPMAPAAADRGVDVPNQATIVVKGNGSGHGRGMSQYGAYSAARQGKGYRAILGFYYPRTRWKKAGGALEVLISADADGDTVVRDVAGLKVRDLAGGRTLAADEPGATRWRIAGSGAASAISWFDGSWHEWETFEGTASFSAGRRALTLVTTDGDLRYRGSLRSDLDDLDQRVTVNDVKLEQYVRGVVASEMPAGWPQQALRAQAVAARTYGAWRRDLRPLDVAYDICDTALCQVYGGASGEARAGNRAASKTAGEVLTYRRRPVFAEFSASNGGWTVKGNKPYLPAKKDRFEGTSRDYYGWKRRVTATQLEDFYHLNNLTRIRIARRDGNGTWGGRVTRLELTTRGGDSPGTYSVDVERFRSTFGLPSTLFTVTKVE